VVVGLPPGKSYFAAGAQEIVTHTVDLAKVISKRLKEIVDFSLKRRFEDASTNLRGSISSPPPLTFFLSSFSCFCFVPVSSLSLSLSLWIKPAPQQHFNFNFS
jgi:hypothetical protein